MIESDIQGNRIIRALAVQSCGPLHVSLRSRPANHWKQNMKCDIIMYIKMQ